MSLRWTAGSAGAQAAAEIGVTHMSEIDRVLHKAAWRLGVNHFLVALVWAAAGAVAIALLLRLFQQAFVFNVPWKELAIGLPGGALVVALAYALGARPGRKDVALTVDQGANLKEAISTALYVANADDAWSRATVETARQAARAVEVKRAVPIGGPRIWPLPLALGLVFLVVYLAVPKLDLFKRSTKIEEAKARSNEAFVLNTSTQELKTKLEQMTQDMDLDTKLDEMLGDTSKPGPTDPEAIRNSALKSLTKLRDELNERMNSESALKVEQARKTLQNIQPPGEQTNDLAKAMSAGDFSQMKQQLEALSNKLQSGQLSQSERDQAAEELKKLAEEINKAVQNPADLAKKLEQAGLDKKLAENPEALKKAIEQANNLTQDQKEQLKKAAEAQKSAAEALSQMAESLNKMASECQNPGKEGQGSKASTAKEGNQESQNSESGQQSQEGMQSAQQMGEQLSEMEQIAQEMEAAQAAMSECQGGMEALGEGQGQCNGMGEGLAMSQNSGEGTGQYSEGDPTGRQGGGSGGPGQGRGGSPGERPADFDTVKRKDNKNQTNNGPIVASRLVEGDAVLNESEAEFVAAVSVATGEVSEEITGNAIPRDRHESVKNYFGRLKRKAEGAAKPAAEKPAADTRPTAPAREAE